MTLGRSAGVAPKGSLRSPTPLRGSGPIRTLRALVPWVVGATALAIGGLIAVRALVDPAVLRASNDEVGNYLQTLGTIYAVLLAFVVFVVWQQFDEARTRVASEATEALDLYRLALCLPTIRGHLEECLQRYVAAVLDHEWSAMGCRSDETIEQIGRILDEVWDELSRHEPASEHERILYGEALERFNDLSDCRTARLTSAAQRIPLAMRLLLYNGAVLTVASLYLLQIDNFAVHAIITGALAGAVSHVLYLIRDLDNAFGGDWQVPRSAFERAQRTMLRWSRAAPAAP